MTLRSGLRWVASVSLSFIALGCAAASPMPLPTASRLATVSPAQSSVEAHATPSQAAIPTLGPAKCATTDTTNYAAVGWLGPRVVLLVDHFVGCDVLEQRLISANPIDGIWRTDATLDTIVQDFQIASDGQSVIAPSAAGVIVISPDGKVAPLSRPATAADGWGGMGFRATGGGGYLVVGAAELDRVSADFGSVTTTALPRGYVAVAPTSDPERFVLAPTDDENLPNGLLGTPFRAYLWDHRTGSLRLVESAATAVLPSSRSLAYLTVQGSEEVSVSRDETITAVTLPGLGWLRSPDGQRYLSPQDSQSRDPQLITLRDSSTGRAIVSFMGTISKPVWRGSAVAIVSGGGDLPSELVVSGSTVVRLSLP